MMPAAETPLLHIAEDPDRAWAEHGGHFLHEARTYAVLAAGGHPLGREVGRPRRWTELRAEGVYRDPDPGRVSWRQGARQLVLHPLCGRDAGGGGMAQPAAVLRGRAAPARPELSRAHAYGVRGAGRAGPARSGEPGQLA